MTDIVATIKAAVNPADYDFSTAEGRKAFDDVLREHLARIEDASVRSHAAELLRQWRRELFPKSEDLVGIFTRLRVIEDRLGLNPPHEIRDLRTHDRPPLGPALKDLMAAYAACNGVDHPAYLAAERALRWPLP